MYPNMLVQCLAAVSLHGAGTPGVPYQLPEEMNSSDGTSPPSSKSGSIGPICTGQDVPGSVTYSQCAACHVTRAACK